jgi:hypothetical protein
MLATRRKGGSTEIESSSVFEEWLRKNVTQPRPTNLGTLPRWFDHVRREACPAY